MWAALEFTLKANIMKSTIIKVVSVLMVSIMFMTCGPNNTNNSGTQAGPETQTDTTSTSAPAERDTAGGGQGDTTRLR